MNQQVEQVKTQDKKYVCLECKNEVTLDQDLKIGDYVECPLCGIEYEVVDVDENGEVTLQLIEEEK
ncbi:MAG: lysine biosynthesis protein LysW [bacterium]